MRLTLAFQSIPPAPGRPASEDEGAAPAPQAVVAQDGAPPAAPQAAPPGGGLMGILPLLLVVPLVLLMFWSSRSQQKKQRAAQEALQKGDRVLLQSGIVGKLLEKGDRLYKIEIAPGVKVDVLKSTVLGKDGAEAAATLEKK